MADAKAIAAGEITYEEHRHANMVERIRIFCIYGGILYMLAWSQDLMEHPEHKWKFLLIRSSVLVILGLCYLATRTSIGRRFALPISMLIGLACAWNCALKSTYMGGFLNDYGKLGGAVCLVFMVGLMPWRALETAVYCVVWSTGYFAIVLLRGYFATVPLRGCQLDDSALSPANYAMFFTFAAVVVTLQMDGYRRRSFELTQQLRETDRLKTQFFSNVSHELRTPLTLILTPLERLLSDAGKAVSAAAKRTLHSMVGNTQRLLRLVNQLLDFSRLEAGTSRVSFELRDVGALVEPVVESFQVFARSKSVKLELRTAEDLPRAHVDPTVLDKVACNLLSNACKFTEPGGAIVVRLAAGEKSVVLSVRDTGIGIPEEQLPKVFDRFHQVDATASRRYEGSGIGLALTKELVDLTGGKIEVESELGVGSTFTVTLPLGTEHVKGRTAVSVGAGAGDEAAPSGPEADGPPCAEGAVAALEAEVGTGKVGAQAAEGGGEDAEAAGAKGEPGPRPLVLVVEDNPDMRSLVADICRSDFRVREAADGREALEAIGEERPALVITDVMMPGMDGHELLRRIRSEPATASLPVVMLTAKAAPEMKIEGLESGADDYLVKPFESRELLARARNMVRLQTQERELRKLNTGLQQEVVSQSVALERARTLGRFLSPDLVRSILEDEGSDLAEPGLDRRRLTAFRLELRGFDDMVEAIAPEDMAAMVNGYLSAMADVAFAHGATLDKFVRDTVVGFLGAPESKGHAEDAVRCARMGKEMWRRAMEVREGWRELVGGEPPMPTMAVASGYATVGNFGSSTRLEYTAMGGPVDEADEILSAIGPGEVVCSETTWRLIQGEVEGEARGEATVRHGSRPVKLYRLEGPARTPLSPRAPIDVPEAHAPTTPVPPPGEGGTPSPSGPAAQTAAVPAGPGAGQLTGSVLAGRYEIGRKLGEGGMGTVYLARDLRLDDDVALKLLRADLKTDPKSLARLRREVKLARLVTHRNVARIYDLGEWQGHEFICMEYIRGEALDARLQDGPLPLGEGRDVLLQVCAGLSAAHAAGVVHRDLKPENIMLERGGRAVILDFGIARGSMPGSRTVTHPHVAIGTPHYMAPEQFRDGKVDRRADIYSLGVMAYEMFTGVPPFDAESVLVLARMHAEEPPPDPLAARPDLPPRLAAVILRCLAKQPRERFSSAGEVASLLVERRSYAGEAVLAT